MAIPRPNDGFVQAPRIAYADDPCRHRNAVHDETPVTVDGAAHGEHVGDRLTVEPVCVQRGGSLQKSTVSRSKSDKKAHAFTLEPDALCGVFQLLNRRKFTLSALNCAIWVLSNRTILTLSCRHPL
jgi:hypothetical protein